MNLQGRSISKNLFTVVAIVSVWFSTMSCSKNNNQYLDEFVKSQGKRLYINSQGWESKRGSFLEGIDELTYYKDENDTTKSLQLLLYLKNDSLALSSYLKVFYMEGIRHELLIKKDTFYYFSGVEPDVQFIVGGYNYKFAHGKLVSPELDYYTLYRDSLSKVKGDYLPTLPALSAEEQKRLKSKLRN